MSPRVSIIMSVYNGEEDLDRAINSILEQTFKDFEFIIINDGSKDNSASKLDYYATIDSRIKVFHQQNLGLGAALNRAVRESSGELIARQDCDDVSTPTRIATQVEYLDKHAEVVLCGTWTWFIDPTLGPQSSKEIPDDNRLLLRYLEKGHNPLVHGSVMFRRDAYNLLPVGYRLSNPAQDFDLWLRLSQVGSIGMVESVEYYFWLSKSGISFSSYVSRQEIVRLILKLHHERVNFGRELTKDVDALELKIIESKSAGKHREPVPEYTKALHYLQIGDYQRYIQEMKKARKIGGSLGLRASLHLLMPIFKHLFRFYYWLRRVNTPEHYVKPLPEGTSLPHFRESNLLKGVA